MARAHIAARKAICLVLISACLAPMVGCVGLVANLLNVVGAGLMPAAFSGLEEKKVAVVCVSNSELFGPTATSSELGIRINRLLAAKVKEIQIVPHQEVAEWIDGNNWDMVDFVAVGRGVKADMVVAVDVDSLSLYEGKTMFKGRSSFHIVVYDVVTGQEVFAKSPPQLVYPRNAGVFTTEISEAQFRKNFLNAMADRIARHFYAFDINEDVADDAAILSRM